jgi:hypothetical protein
MRVKLVVLFKKKAPIRQYKLSQSLNLTFVGRAACGPKISNIIEPIALEP